MNNFLISALYSSDHKAQFVQTIREMRSITGLPPFDQLKMERIVHYHELNYHVNYGNFLEGKAFIRRLNRWLEKHRRHLAPQRLLVLEQNIACFFFAYGEFRNAHQHLQRLMNVPDKTVRVDIRNFARLLELIIQYELGNFQVGEYALRATYRSFRKNKVLYPYEKAILHFIRERQKYPAGSIEYRRTAIELKEKLNKIRETEGENAIGLPMISIWLGSQIEEIPIRQHFESLMSAQKQSPA